MPASSAASRKAKGRGLQKQIVDKFVKMFPQLDGNCHWRSMGASGTDVYFSRDFSSEFPWAIEAKCVESLNIWAALKQTEANTDTYAKLPLLVFKRNHTDTYACLKLDDLLELIRKSQGVV